MYANGLNYYYDNEESFESIDAAILYYYNLSSGDDWQSYLRALAKAEVRDKLIFYYIFNVEGYMPGEEEYTEKYNAIVANEMKSIVEEHADELEGLEGAEYDAQVELLKNKMLDYVGDFTMRELVYFEIGNEKIIKNLLIVE